MTSSLAWLCRIGFITCSADLVGAPKAEVKDHKREQKFTATMTSLPFVL